MEPLIPTKSVVFGIKFPYFIRTPDSLPFTKVGLPYFHQTIIKPELNGTFIFYSPINPVSHPVHKSVFLKKLIALPGDSVYYSNNRYSITAENMSSKTYLKTIIPYKGYEVQIDTSLSLYWKTLIERDSKIRLNPNSLPQKYKFNQNFYFFTGLHPNSSDSRIWGMVPESNLISKVIFIF